VRDGTAPCLLNSVMAAQQDDRLRALVDAGIALTSELSLDALLQRLVEAAAGLTGARYAALGVIDASGRMLERFVTTGISGETHARIGDLPRGRGILGVLIREAQPLRLADISDDPRSVGFPPHHPPMKTFLGVPIILRGVAFGNLYLTEKEGGGEFTDADQEAASLLAAQAAVAIENARLYESATRWLRQLESLSEVGNALATEIELEPLLDLVARRLRELVDARIVAIALPDDQSRLVFRAVAGEGADAVVALGAAEQHSKLQRVYERGRSERLDSVVDDPEIDQVAARRIGMGTALYVPLIARERAIGVVLCADKLGGDPRFSDDDRRLAETLAARAATAVDLSERVHRDAVRRVVAAQELERKHLARELHDETGQALTAFLLGLRSVEEAETLEEARGRAASLRDRVVLTLKEVRALAVELRPAALDDFGLLPALERLADTFRERSGLVVELEARLGSRRLAPEAETTVYRTVQEALTNVFKHAEARRVSIVVTERNGKVAAVIEDDGRGFDMTAQRADSLGLVGMRERVALVGGRLAVESEPGGGTTVVVEVPAA
jgi:signal transduction histidine kinase